MVTIDEFLQEVRSINWFGHSKKATDKYHVIHSVFEAYDDWNEQIDKIFSIHYWKFIKMDISPVYG